MSNEWVLVENQGEINLALLELMGASLKEGEDKIGVFGTGWKYGLALALRRNINVVIFSGKEKIEFSTISEEIGDQTFDRIAISVNGKRRRKTSLTTRMGMKDWDDEWFFLREVISNALDEEGYRLYGWDEELQGIEGKTRVFISKTPRLQEVLSNQNLYIRRDKSEGETVNNGRILPPLSEKSRIYKQGIFVMEMDRKGLYDYDLSNLKLTESRTSDRWNVLNQIRQVLVSSSVDTRTEVLQQLRFNTSSKDLIESDVDFDWYSDGKVWTEAFQNAFDEDSVISHGTPLVKKTLEANGKTAIVLPPALIAVLKKGQDVPNEDDFMGTALKNGYVTREASTYEQQLLDKTQEVMKGLFGDLIDKHQFSVFVAEDHNKMVDYLVEDDGESHTIVVSEKILHRGLRDTISYVYSSFLINLNEESNEDEFADVISPILMEKILPSMGVII